MLCSFPDGDLCIHHHKQQLPAGYSAALLPAARSVAGQVIYTTPVCLRVPADREDVLWRLREAAAEAVPEQLP